MQPKLRFKAPAEKSFGSWEKCKLNEFIEDHKGGAPLQPSDFLATGNYEVIPKKAITSGGKLNLDMITPTFCTEAFFVANQRSVVDKNYLVTTLRDLVPTGPSIGYIVKLDTKAKYLLAQGVYGLKINQRLDENFLIQFSNTMKYRKLMQTMMVGSTQVHIRNSDFFELQLYLPSIVEQTKIASFLSAVDEKIAQLTKKHELLSQYKKGVMQKIFSQELRFKADDGSDYPDWKKKRLSDVAQIVGGGTPDTTNMELWNGDIQWFTPTEIRSKYTSKSKRTITLKGLQSSSAKLLPIGTLLFTSRATIGEVSIATNECCTNQGFQSFIANHSQSLNLFLYYWIKQNKNAFLEKCTGSTFLEISKKDIERLDILTPSLLEQTKIANFLSTIDDKIHNAQSQLEAIKQYKQGLLQQMFV
jgi:type I restriction enzyme S subunit